MAEGDPRVLFVMNTVLSMALSASVVWGLAVIDVFAFSWERVAVGAAVLFVLTYLVVLR